MDGGRHVGTGRRDGFSGAPLPPVDSSTGRVEAVSGARGETGGRLRCARGVSSIRISGTLECLGTFQDPPPDFHVPFWYHLLRKNEGPRKSGGWHPGINRGPFLFQGATHPTSGDPPPDCPASRKNNIVNFFIFLDWPLLQSGKIKS